MNPFGAVTLNRIPPQGDPQHYKTYGALSPLSTHFRNGTCEEADCLAYREGWVTTVDLGTELGQRQARYITHDKTRRWTLQKVSDRMVKFVFAAGQQCYRKHRIRIDRPARFLVRGGDWRGNPTGFRREHKRAEDWVEDQIETLDRIETARNRG